MLPQTGYLRRTAAIETGETASSRQVLAHRFSAEYRLNHAASFADDPYAFECLLTLVQTQACKVDYHTDGAYESYGYVGRDAGVQDKLQTYLALHETTPKAATGATLVGQHSSRRPLS